MGSSRASTAAGKRRAAKSAAARGRRATPARRPATPKRAPQSAKPKRTRSKPAKPRSANTTVRRAPSASAKRSGRAPGSRLRALLSLRTLAVLVFAAAVLGATYQFWFRDSSLVAVEDVRVKGMRGPEAEPVTDALERAAKQMSTLNVDRAALDAAVAGFPTVAGVEADTDFPHGLTLTVRERPPVMLAKRGSQTVPVAGDGTVLTGVNIGAAKVPLVTVPDLPNRGALTGEGLELAKTLGAAPAPLRRRVEEIVHGTTGIEATLAGGIPVYLGGADRAAEKWAAVAAILADPSVDTLTYIDVRVHERPAIGGAAPQMDAQTTPTSEPEVVP